MGLWNYCAICGKRIEVGETCYGVTKSGADLVVGESICKDCLEIENQPNNPETNADRIKAMSDEELATFIVDKSPGMFSCNGRCLHWLKHPADD